LKIHFCAFERRPRRFKNLLRREKGSCYLKSKKFKFGRSTKTVLADGWSTNYRQVPRAFSYRLASNGRALEKFGWQEQGLVQELEHLEKVVNSRSMKSKKKSQHENKSPIKTLRRQEFLNSYEAIYD